MIKYLINSDQVISTIDEDVYLNIKKSYTGGATDMYIPSNLDKNKKPLNQKFIFGYDVNSLYPYIMKNFEVPVGKPTYFEGDIRKFETNAFGFFYCNVECPKDLKHPILQLHIKRNSSVNRTISPTGTFSAWIFSPELDNAVKYGYKYKIIKGYTFNKLCIFRKYVETLYTMRLEYSKDHPMNYICKLLLNSLYGRFAMNFIFESIELVDHLKLAYMEANIDNVYKITNQVDFKNKVLVHYTQNYDELGENIKKSNVNIGIASAITGYARIYMSQFKNNPLLKLFYTDTDSIYTDLTPEQINKIISGIINEKELGKLKLEHIAKRAIFISPKCYALETVNNKVYYKIKGLNKKGRHNF